MKSYYVYVAGPLFTYGDRKEMEVINKVVEGIGNVDISTFLPQRDGGVLNVTADSPKDIYDMDIAAVNKCDFMVANINGAELDAGTAVEIGLAQAMNKPVVLYRQDSRNRMMNLMITKGDTETVYSNISELEDGIREAIRRCQNIK